MSYLTEDEGIEYEGIDYCSGIRAIESQYLLPDEIEDQQNSQLINALTKDIPPHGSGNKTIVSSYGRPLHKAFVWWFSSQCKCT